MKIKKRYLKPGKFSILFFHHIFLVSCSRDWKIESPNLKMHAFGSLKRYVGFFDCQPHFLCVSLFLVSISVEIVLIQVDSVCLIEVCVLVAQSCLTLCDPMDCSPPGSPIHGIFQARILEWVAI